MALEILLSPVVGKELFWNKFLLSTGSETNQSHFYQVRTLIMSWSESMRERPIC